MTPKWRRARTNAGLVKAAMRWAASMPTVGRGDHQRSWPAVARGSLHFWAGGRQQPPNAAPRHDDPYDHLRGLEVTGHGLVPQDHLQGVQSRHLGLAQLGHRLNELRTEFLLHEVMNGALVGIAQLVGDLLIGAALTEELQARTRRRPAKARLR